MIRPEYVLWEITDLLLSGDSPDKVLEAIADGLRDLVPHDTFTLYEADPSLRIHRPALVRDCYSQEILDMGDLPYGVGITGTVAESGLPQLVNDAHLDPRSRQVPGTPDEPESLIAIPLIARKELKGVLCLYRLGEDKHFSEDEFHVATRFGKLAALAIDNAQTRARLETEVITDHLTRVHNRRYFQQRLKQEMQRSARQGTKLGLLIYDLDDFKGVNDTAGHVVGDQVLQKVASLSKDTCRAEDVVCRIGGEEFAVILPGCSIEEASAVGERLRGAIARASFPDGRRITVSVGVAVAGVHASSASELLFFADVALLRAKRAGKDRVWVYAAEGAKAGTSS